MKMKTTIAVLAGVMVVTSAFAQGVVTFRNGPTSAVLDSTTGLPAAAGLYEAGLYYNLNLSAVPDLAVPNDGWILAAVTPILGSLGGGIYSAGQVPIPNVPGTTVVRLQVRAWSVQYDSYEQAFRAGAAAKIGGSPNTIQVTLARAGTTDTVPSTLNSDGGIRGFTVTPVPEPSTVLLGLLGGLGAMVLLRRRS